MGSKRSRLRLVGVLALAFSITAGLSVTTAEAQKKGKKKKKSNVTRTCTNIPVPDRIAGLAWGQAVCEMKIGNKFKGFQVGRVELRDATVTGTETAALNDQAWDLVSSEGTAAFADPPGTPPATLFTTAGPFTQKPNTQTSVCPAPPCGNPFATASPPYQGATYQNAGLTVFKNEKVRGTWRLFLWDTGAGDGTATLNRAQLFIKFYKPPKNS